MRTLIKKINIIKDDFVKEFNDKLFIIQHDLTFNHQALNLPKEDLDTLRETRTKTLQLVYGLNDVQKL